MSLFPQTSGCRRGAAAAWLVVLAVAAGAQEPTSELERRLAAASGAERVEVLLELARAHEFRDPERVREHAGQALAEARELGLAGLEARALLTIGSGWFQDGDLERAEAQFGAGLAAATPLALDDVVGGCLNGLAAVALKRGDQEQALELFGRALGPLEAGELRLRRDAVAGLAVLAERQGRFHRALELQRLVSELESRIFSRDTIATVTSMESRFEAERREREIELLTAEREIQELRAAVASSSVPCPAGELACTVTVGVATHRAGEVPGDTVRLADEAMYGGKRAGKNRVVLEPDAELRTV